MKIASILFKLALWVFILAIPLAGVWLASSLAAYANGPVWLTILAGALLFPVLPILWDAFSRWRRARSRSKAPTSLFGDRHADAKAAIALRWSDRVLLRTLFLNVLFVAGLVWKYPHDVFTAVAARGDWMLDGVEAEWADSARNRLYGAADWMRARLETEETNPFEEQLSDTDSIEPPAPPSGPEPSPEPAPVATPDPAPEPVVPAWTPTLHIQDPYLVEDTLAAARRVTSDAVFADDEALESALRGARVIPPRNLLRWRYAAGRRADAHRLRAPMFPAHGVDGVEIRAPYLRITLTESASRTLCATSREHVGRRLFALAEGRVKTWIEVHEPLCDGVVAMPLDPTQQADDYEVTPEQNVRGATDHWPTPDAPHPLASSIPTAHEGSIRDVANYIKGREADPHRRFKALHDYVVTRVAYDVESLQPGRRRPQDADTVFRERRGVCAGYANLLTALGREAGYEIANVSGRTRSNDGNLAGGFHAWNAVKIEGDWYLVNPTWNAGSVGAGGFTFGYRTAYLFTPPAVFSVDHLPSKSGWQLQPPISQGGFVRQPYLNPDFYRRGLRLVSPQRSQVTVRSSADIEIDNPQQASVAATIVKTGDDCRVEGKARLRIRCDLPGSGTWQVVLFSGERAATQLRSVGRIEYVVP